MEKAEKRLLDVTHVAQILNLSESRVYEVVRHGLLPSVRIGRQIRFDPDKLQEFIDAGGRALPGGWRKDA